MTDKSEQWLSNGKCNICRRKEYCSKPCKACKDRRQYELECAVNRAMVRKMYQEPKGEQANEHK